MPTFADPAMPCPKDGCDARFWTYDGLDRHLTKSHRNGRKPRRLPRGPTAVSAVALSIGSKVTVVIHQEVSDA